MQTNGQRALRVLQIRIVQITAVERPIIDPIDRHLKVFDFLAVRVAHHVTDAAVIQALGPILGVPDNLVNAIA